METETFFTGGLSIEAKVMEYYKQSVLDAAKLTPLKVFKVKDLDCLHPLEFIKLGCSFGTSNDMIMKIHDKRPTFSDLIRDH
ncbi:unnamed protein product [Ambrosiozyma monospora]|uniref:Unnamed protein product n=1 Tax=Ambrosiozyma monospora TaxID=43982 RepID=A0ACB5TCZ2_AMBMO|nr:unnamed protein product [Ambrosiozyma monospora]